MKASLKAVVADLPSWAVHWVVWDQESVGMNSSHTSDVQCKLNMRIFLLAFRCAYNKGSHNVLWIVLFNL